MLFFLLESLFWSYNDVVIIFVVSDALRDDGTGGVSGIWADLTGRWLLCYPRAGTRRGRAARLQAMRTLMDSILASTASRS